MRFSFIHIAPLALIAASVPRAFSQNTTSTPQSQTIPKTWDECIGAGIAVMWQVAKAQDGAAISDLSLDMGCYSLREKPCMLDICKSDPGVKTALEGYVTIFCSNESLKTVQDNCFQYADHDAIAAGFKAQAPVRAMGIVGMMVALALGSL